MPDIRIMVGPQQDFVESTARHPAYIGGRGAGKTVASVFKTFKYVQEHPGAYGCVTVPVMDDVSRFLLPTMRKFFREAEGIGWVWLEKKAILKFPELQSEVFVRSGQDAESVLGMTLAFFDMQEAGSGDQFQTFLNLQGTLRQEGYPHQGWLSTTPNVQRPWLKMLYKDRVFPLTEQPLQYPDEYPVFRARTQDNAFLPESMRRQLVADWGPTRLAQQELEGEFIAVEGVAFPELSEKTHLRSRPVDHPIKRWLCGFDPGGVRPTALVLLGEDESGRLWAEKEFYRPQCPEEDWVRWAAEEGLDTIIGDPSISERQGIELRQRYGIRVQPARFKDFQMRYKAWLHRLAPRSDGSGPGIYISPSCPNLWSELQSLAFAKPKGYNDPIDHWVPGSMDHCLAGTTLVDTVTGQVPIRDLTDSGRVYGGAYPHSPVRLTKRDEPVVEIKFKDGRLVRATYDHKFLTTEGWMEARDLERQHVIDVGQLLQYNNLHGGDSQPDPAALSGQDLLSVREVFSAAGNTPSQEGLGALQRSNPERLARSPQGSRPLKQSDRKSDPYAARRASWPPFAHHHPRYAYSAQAEPEGNKDVALLSRGEALASKAWPRHLEEPPVPNRGLRHLPKAVRDALQGIGLDVLTSLSAEVATVTAAGSEDVYDISVLDARSFTVEGGLVVHNSYDAGAYAIMEFDSPSYGRPRPTIEFAGFRTI